MVSLYFFNQLTLFNPMQLHEILNTRRLLAIHSYHFEKSIYLWYWITGYHLTLHHVTNVNVCVKPLYREYMPLWYFKKHFSSLSKWKVSTWSPEPLQENQHLNKSEQLIILGILHVYRPSLRKNVNKIFNETHYYLLGSSSFTITNFFLTTLLLTKSNGLFYLQVPNGLHNYNSNELNRKWL